MSQITPLPFKPEGYTSVAPYLTVDGVRRTIDFLAKVFNAETLRTFSGEGDKIAHAEVRIDDTVIMLTDAVDGWPAIPSHVHIYVRDVDATFQKALDAGATAVKQPVQEGDPDKRGGFTDLGGTTWWISTQIG